MTASSGRELMRGAVFVGVVMSVCIYSIYLGFLHVLPALAPATFEGTWWLHFGCFLFLALNFFFHYFACIVKDPGTHLSAGFGRLIDEARGRGLLLSSSASAVATESDHDEGHRGGWLLRNKPFSWSVCVRALSTKPPRAHFCKVTGRLVLEMDHYCVWVFNCIGFANYRHFYLALLWLTLGCVFALVETTVVYNFTPPWVPPPPPVDENGEEAELSFLGLLLQNGIVGPAGPLFFLCLVTGVCACVVGPFLAWHTYLTVHAMTTVEYAGAQIRAQSGGGLTRSGYFVGGSWWLTWCERLGLLGGAYPIAGAGNGGNGNRARGVMLVLLRLLLPWMQRRAVGVWFAPTTYWQLPMLSRRPR